MIAVLIASAVFVGLAVVVLLWADHDYESLGLLSVRSKIALWLLYVVHADVVGSVAWAGALPLNLVSAGVGIPLGGAVVVAGMGLFLWSSTALARAAQHRELLLTTGPFALMRHPQNTGWVIMLIGVSVAGQSGLALILVALVTIIAVLLGAIEERHLAERFGDAWDRYRAATPALWLSRGRTHPAEGT